MVIETYYRKRYEKTQQPNISDMNQRRQKEPERGSSVIAAAQSPVFVRHHHVPPPPSSDHCSQIFNGECEKPQMRNHIEVGQLYEIDHIHLPPGTPVQFRSIRVAMVTERTDVEVSVRYPSTESLRAFFCCTTRETHPTLDEKFVMGTDLAVKVLSQLIPAEIYSDQKTSESFWLMTSSDRDVEKKNGTMNNKGGCLSALKCNGMVGWGVRKQVKYLKRHKDIDDADVNGQNSSSSFVDGLFKAHMELGDAEEENDDDRGDAVKNGAESVEKDEDVEESEKEEDDGSDDQENEGEEEESKGKISEENGKNILKRKRYPMRRTGGKKQSIQIIEKKKQLKKKIQTQLKKNKKPKFKEALILRNPKNRWSADRYKLAEQSLLEVMKAKGATFDKPLLRPQLRAEARNFIGDTGLLDHLLKHMAGKLAPDGEQRFRRRHNADGAMEYWLESSELVNIRKEAGIHDPYWVPPTGWKPGDSPTQDPICARELKLLKDDSYKMKEDWSRMKSCIEQFEEELEILRRKEFENDLSSRRQDQNQAFTSGSSQMFDHIASLLSTKCESEKEKLKELLVEMFSEFAEEIFGKSKATLVPNPMGKSELIFPTEASTDNKEKKQFAMEEPAQYKQQQNKVQQAFMVNKPEMIKNQSTVKAQAAEQKAAKIERLKSGFRICKPHGTFLWPNMASKSNFSSNDVMGSPQVTVQVEVPDPPSVSSSAAGAPFLPPYHRHQCIHAPPSPVKPLAERRAVTVTVSTVSSGRQNYDRHGFNSYSSTTTSKINPNEEPNPNPCFMPLLLSSDSANINPWENAGYEQMKFHNGCYFSSASNLASQVGN